ncbi:hypothetical protein CMT69_12690 [Elizabethkingia anophelis]|nr:hypothetical protein [Elizabethkingia anophelis]MCT4320680.1 hypothetical protein [Elizabethkingia anophelis]MDV3945784.1 hypothetical protein [Elizabethkingia anophelis]
MSRKGCFNVSLKRTSITTLSKNDIQYTEESYALRIKRSDESKSNAWIITIERFEEYKVIVLSFYLTKHRNGKGAKKFTRNTGDDCIDPIVTLQLFRECIKLCRNEQNESYSFCFYALDDEYNTRREDMNRRMAVFTMFLQRREDLKNHILVNIGNIQDSIYLGYDPQKCSQETMQSFLTFYKPILTQEIKDLFLGEQESKKL